MNIKKLVEHTSLALNEANDWEASVKFIVNTLKRAGLDTEDTPAGVLLKKDETPLMIVGTYSTAAAKLPAVYMSEELTDALARTGFSVQDVAPYGVGADLLGGKIGDMRVGIAFIFHAYHPTCLRQALNKIVKPLFTTLKALGKQQS